MISNRTYILGVLTVVSAVNQLDRQVLGILLEPIKREFGASDAAMGLLVGFAFVLFYTAAGVPLARLSDRGTRRSILAAGLAVWSAMTALCGVAQSVVQLALVRIGVGVGEATATPASASMITDLYPPERRSTAFAIFNFGAGMGVMLALPVGGWLEELYGWRAAFLIIGLPGLALALAIRLTVREPTRTQSAEASEAPPISEAVRGLWRVRSYRHSVLANGLYCAPVYGIYAFSAPFLIRVHGMSTGEAGSWLGPIFALGALGVLAGGVVVDRLHARDVRWNFWMTAVGLAVSTPLLLLFLFLPGSMADLLCLALFTFLAGTGFSFAPAYAITQAVATPRTRATSTALMLVFLNVVGAGVGPYLAGVLSDFFQGPFGDESLRYALLSGALLQVWSIVHLMLGARTFESDMRAASGE